MLTQQLGSLVDRERMVTATPQTTVYEAAQLMRKHEIGAILVVEGDALVGIFTERDAVFRSIAQDRDAGQVQLHEVMTKCPITADPGMSLGRALLIMHEHHFRHLPVVENGKPIGIVSARDALDPDLEDFVCEERRRESLR